MEKPATKPGPDCAMARGNREHRCECQPDQDALALLSGRVCPQAGDRCSAGADFPGGSKGAMNRGILVLRPPGLIRGNRTIELKCAYAGHFTRRSASAYPLRCQ